MEAVIFVGLQGAGKSTFYRQYFFNTHIRINLDMLKTRYRENLLLRACLEMKQPFVVDNTNPTVAERARYLPLAKAARFLLTGYFFVPDLGESLRRNETRPDKERIPPKGIAATFHKLQPPTLEEGFDRIYQVRSGESGNFIVTEWVPASPSL